MHAIQIGRRYYCAKGGYFGRLSGRADATLFPTLSDANDKASRLMHTTRVVPVSVAPHVKQMAITGVNTCPSETVL